ncbi:hypothetical protein [Nocardiopsis sp. FR4]|uniref:hypothetical protein n=1 Tax=Nocardiopsis sp. FR4 TaxID=2605985 RepID=UPI00135AAE3D|nr:hypothetical protein [Nocardiopsis sp. FR4]
MSSTLTSAPLRRPSRRARLMAAAAAAGAVMFAASACGLLDDAPDPAVMAEHQAMLANCQDTAPGSLVLVDGTGSSNTEAITAERLDAIEHIARQTAVCSGYLRVAVFSSSSAATTALYDGALHPHGATDNARIRRVPALIEDVIPGIREGYEPAMAELPGGGSDILGMLRLGEEFAGQLSTDYHLELYLFSDGFHNVGHKPGSEALSLEEAEALAAETTMPDLSGASVTVAGIGRVAGDPVPSDVVEGLVFYYQALCAQTGAEECLAVTDFNVTAR